MASSESVLKHMSELIEKLDHGARLPTVRDLMKRFGVSQGAVQGALSRLRDDGLLSSQVGRGTYVVKASSGTASGVKRGRMPTLPDQAALDTLLILSNASMNERCILVQNRIVAQVTAEGGKVVQMSYHDTDQLLGLLESIPDFTAAILQSHYERIPVRLLHLLQAKTRALVLDGHTVCGVDIDRVGTDWEEALSLALDHLSTIGHHRIGLVALDTDAQPILSARRAFSRLSHWRGDALDIAAPILLPDVRHPSQHVGDALARALSERLRQDRSFPFTALICLGISDAIGVRQSLETLGIGVPETLSVHLLGHFDVPTEHFEQFTIAGSSHREGSDALLAGLKRRLAAPDLPPQITYLPCRQVLRSSTQAPRPAPKAARRRRA
jgi:DNA-binding LacI/PurR family transcriptional regulator